MVSFLKFTTAIISGQSVGVKWIKRRRVLTQKPGQWVMARVVVVNNPKEITISYNNKLEWTSWITWWNRTNFPLYARTLPFLLLLDMLTVWTICKSQSILPFGLPSPIMWRASAEWLQSWPVITEGIMGIAGKRYELCTYTCGYVSCRSSAAWFYSTNCSMGRVSHVGK